MLTLRMNYELDQLMGTYADWIAWLKEKEANLEGQLARMRGKSAGEPGSKGEGEMASKGAGVQGSVGEPVTGSGEREAVSEIPTVDMPPETEDTSSLPAINGSEVHPSVAEDDEEDDWL